MTVLHAGGKFGGEGYKISGGLHGVGVSVVNALSSRLDVEIHRDGGKWEQHFAKGGKPQDKLTRTGAVEEARHDHHVLARRDDLRGDRVPRPDAHRAPARDGVPHEGPRDPLPRRARRSGARAGLQVQRRHQRLREAPQRDEGAAVQAGHRLHRETGDDYEVDVAMQWNTGFYEGIHSFANNIATTEGGMHEEGFKKSLTNVVNRYAQGQGPAQGEGRQPPRRRHPGGAHRHPVGEAAQPAVRGPDQGEARQHRDALAGREGHQREARRLARGAPDRGAPGGGQGEPGGEGARRGAPGARPHAAQVAARVVGDAGQARRLLVEEPARCASCSSSRATAPAAPPSAPATPRSRPSSRSAGRSSTSSAPASTAC